MSASPTNLKSLPIESADPLIETAPLSISVGAEEHRGGASPPFIPQLLRWGMIVGEFGAVQVAVQAVGAVAGFIIVRSLAKPEYALYAVANAGLSMFNMLADIGISPALRSIGGEVHDDRARFSQLVATVCQLRRLFSAFAFLISVPVTAWMLLSNGAGYVQTGVLCAVVLVASWPLLAATVLRDAALMLGKYRKVQFVDFTTAAVRLTCIVAAFAWLNALLGIVFAGLANWVQWYVYKRRSPEDFDVAAGSDDAYRRRVLAVTKRVMPNTLFFCFQGQVTFVLLTLFGTSASLADVAALGRIAALLAIFGTVFNNVLAPRFARCQDAYRLPHLYLALVGLTAMFLAPIAALAWFFPQALLLILGSAYSGLDYECFLMVVAACLYQLGGVMAWLIFCRNWLRWFAYLNIPSILAAQAVCILLLDLSTVRGVLLFSIVSALAPMPVLLADTWQGLQTLVESRATESN